MSQAQVPTAGRPGAVDKAICVHSRLLTALHETGPWPRMNWNWRDLRPETSRGQGGTKPVFAAMVVHDCGLGLSAVLRVEGADSPSRLQSEIWGRGLVVGLHCALVSG